MRVRLQATLTVMMTVVVVALAAPLAGIIADIQQQRVLVDRLADTKRLASVAEQSTTDVDTRALRGDLDQYARVHGIRSAVYTLDADVRMASHGSGAWQSADVLQHVQVALSGRGDSTASRIWPWESRDLVVAEPVVRDGDVIGSLVTVSPTDRLRQQVGQWMLLIALASLGAVFGCLTVAARITSWVLRPVVQLDRAAHQIGAGKLAARAPGAGGPPELRRLARSFNDMAAHVEAAASRQAAFVADASHQLRNPLHALQLRIDQLELEHAERTDSHRLVRAEARRLARILDELLRLARVEGPVGDSEEVDVAAVVADRLDAWSPVAVDRGIRLDVAAGQAVADLEPTALGTALDAVLDNALKFTPRDGSVTVQVREEASNVVVAVADSGPGLTDAELDRATDRFWRGPRHHDVAGTGLGLSIAQAVLQKYGARIDLAHNEPRGLCVRLVLRRHGPAAVRALTA